MNQQEVKNKILEISPIGMVVLDKDGKITLANREAEKVLGLTKSKISELTYDSPIWKITDLKGNPFPKEQLPFFLVMNSHESVYNIEHAIEWPDGTRIYLSVNAAPITNDFDEIEGVTATIQNITDRILIEEKLQQSEKRYRDLFDNLIDEVHVWRVIRDATDKIQSWELVDANSRALKSWNKTKDQVKGKNAIELFGSDAIQTFKPIIENIYETNQPYSWEVFFEPTHQYLAMDSIPLGEFFISTGRDITDKIKINEDLKKAKNQAELAKDIAVQAQLQLKQTQSMAKVGGWEFELATGLFQFNDNFYEIFRSSAERIGGYQMTANAYAERFVHPDDRDVVSKEIERASQTDTPEFKAYLEHKVVYEGGDIGYIVVQYFIIKDEQGNTVKLYGFIQDISNRKFAEEAVLLEKKKLEESESRFMIASQSAHLGIWDWDVKENILVWNDRMYLQYGVDKTNTLNNFELWSSSLHPDDRETAIQEVKDALTGTKDFDTSFRIVRSDGTIRHIKGNALVLRDSLGNAIRIIGVNQDITDATEREIELQKAKEKAERREFELAESQKIAKIGSWYLNLSTNELLWSEELYHIFGLDPSCQVPPYAEYLKLFTEESWNRLLEESTSTVDTGIPFEVELNSIRQDQTQGWMWIRGEAIFNPDKIIVGLRGVAQDITEKKKLELDLISAKVKAEENEAKLLEAQALSHVGSWEYITETDTVMWSKELFNIFERSPELSAPRYSEQQSFYTKESFELLDHAVQDCLQNQVPYEIELDIITSKGRLKQIISKGTVKRNKENKIVGCYGTAQDITEHKKLESALISAKEIAEGSAMRYHSLITNLEIGVVVHNGDTSILLCNSRATTLLGLSEDQMRGKVAIDPYWKFIYEDERALPVEEYPVMRVLSKKRPIKNQILGVCRRNGEVVWLIVNGFPVLDNNDEVSEVIISFNDITELKLAEKELLIAKEKAEKSDKLKTSFLQNLSHEIRTPLNAICGFAQILDSQSLSDESRKNYTSLIQSSSNQLLSIVSDILLASTLERGQETVSIKECNINSVLESLFLLFKTKADAKDLKLCLVKDLSDADSLVETDETKLSQVLINLLTNAIKFTDAGEIVFGYTVEGGDTLQFYVRDTGIGIDAEAHETIFERFRQADSSIAIKYGGNGLGLSISKGYVELLGGKMWLHSEVGKGSIFYFSIPYHPVRRQDIKNQNAGLTILIAEDEILNFMVIEGMLMNLQATLIHAKDGQEAVNLFKQNPHVHLVLMDMKMPVLTGDLAAVAIKSINPKVPIIAQSGYTLENEKSHYKNIFDDYLVKPINENILIQKISKYTNTLNG